MAPDSATLTEKELVPISEMLGCTLEQTIHCLTDRSTHPDPPPSVAQLVQIDKDEKHGTGLCECCVKRIERGRVSDASFLEKQRAVCIKKHTLIAPRKSATPYVGKSIAAQDASAVPPFEDWRYAILANQVSMSENWDLPLPDMTNAILFGHVLALPVPHARELQIMLVDSAGETFDVWARQTDDEVARGFQVRFQPCRLHATSLLTVAACLPRAHICRPLAATCSGSAGLASMSLRLQTSTLLHRHASRQLTSSSR